jgi:hypothetical protein
MLMYTKRASRALIRGWGRPVTSEGHNAPRRRHIVVPDWPSA